MNRFLVLLFLTLVSSAQLSAQIIGTANDLLDDQTTFSNRVLQVREYVRLPSNSSVGNLNSRQIISMTNRPGDGNAFYTTSQDGSIYRITDNAGSGVATPWFNVNNSIQVNSTNSFHGGLRSIQFHPDFNNASASGYGKFYGSLMAGQTNSMANFLGTSTGNFESVVSEWTYDFTAAQVNSSSYRELFRIR
ncbi:MAG: hypothetical protein WBD31_12890, partial [Rubripirellula sp.]